LRASCLYCILISVSDAPRPRPRILSEWDMLRPTMEQRVGSLSHRFGSYWVPVVLDCCCAWGRSGVLGCSSSSSSVVSLSLSELSPFGVDPLVARRACQDGKGPQSAGCSSVGVLGCNSRSTSWFQ
jgi:hypothetical protein